MFVLWGCVFAFMLCAQVGLVFVWRLATFATEGRTFNERAFSAVNGVLVAFGRVPSIIVTLGTLALLRSFLVEYSDARTITTASLPQWLVELPQANAFSILGLDVRVTVVAKVTGRTAHSATFGRAVGILDDGNCGEAQGTRSSVQVRLALAPDGYLPDAYGIHEMAHALAYSLGLGGHLRPEWKSWVLGWHP